MRNCCALLAAWTLAALASDSALAQTERYRLTVHNTWSTTSHPGLFPNEAHFSHLGGGTHSAGVDFWQEGTLASVGMVRMAETGAVDLLEAEVGNAVTAGTADQGHGIDSH